MTFCSHLFFTFVWLFLFYSVFVFCFFRVLARFWVCLHLFVVFSYLFFNNKPFLECYLCSNLVSSVFLVFDIWSNSLQHFIALYFHNKYASEGERESAQMKPLKKKHLWGSHDSRWWKRHFNISVVGKTVTASLWLGLKKCSLPSSLSWNDKKKTTNMGIKFKMTSGFLFTDFTLKPPDWWLKLRLTQVSCQTETGWVMLNDKPLCLL